MKAYLVVLLFALTACSFPDLEKLFTCVIKSPTIAADLQKVVEAIKNKDINSLITLFFTEFPKIKKEIIECLDEPVLKGCHRLKTLECLNNCLKSLVRDKNIKEGNTCISNCRKNFC